MEILAKFISGEITAREFENELYTNAELEELLRQSTDWHGTFVGNCATNLYNYLIMLDYSRTDCIASAVDALGLYFTKAGIAVPGQNKYADFYDLVSAAQPKYLNVDTGFIEQYILPADGDLTKTELKKAMRANFNRYFRYQNKPPGWLQNPAWPIQNDKPLFFVGQLELKSESFHDNGAVYVFLDEATGTIETIKQFY